MTHAPTHHAPRVVEASTAIRPAVPAELDTIRDLMLAVGLSQDRSRISVTFGGSTYWLALEAGVPIGCVGLEHGQGVSLLRSAAVLPGARSHGVGRALAQSALTMASLRGDRAVYLFSSGAGAYWQRLGFDQVPVAELEAALPDTPQVKNGQHHGWLYSELAWKRVLDT
jgi:N-acetylglutamate synthase-like GNAT family acetyltransferase